MTLTTKFDIGDVVSVRCAVYNKEEFVFRVTAIKASKNKENNGFNLYYTGNKVDLWHREDYLVKVA